MKRKNLIIIGTIGGIVLLALILTSIYATRDGRLVTPQGSGSVTLDVGSFEAFLFPIIPPPLWATAIRVFHRGGPRP